MILDIVLWEEIICIRFQFARIIVPNVSGASPQDLKYLKNDYGSQESSRLLRTTVGAADFLLVAVFYTKQKMKFNNKKKKVLESKNLSNAAKLFFFTRPVFFFGI